MPDENHIWDAMEAAAASGEPVTAPADKVNELVAALPDEDWDKEPTGYTLTHKASGRSFDLLIGDEDTTGV